MSILSNRGFRLETTTNSKRAREMPNTPRRRLQEGKRHPRVPSPPARQKPCKIFIRSSHISAPRRNWAARPSSFAPPPPQHLAVASAKPRTANRPHREEKRGPTSTIHLAEGQQPPNTSGRSPNRREGYHPLQGTTLRRPST